MNSHIDLFIQEIKEIRSGFHIKQTKRHDQMQCQMSIANKSENSETPIKQCTNDKLRNLLERQLITKCNARFPQSL